jgi:hypothetical protein
MTPDEELDQLLAGGESAPAGDPDAELDALLAAEQPAAAPKQSKVIDMPVQHIEGEVKKDPWYSRFIPNGKALAHGAAAGATANWGEEGTAGILSLLPTDTSKDGGIPREYAAGSQYADTHKVLEGENAALRAEHPVSFGAGEMLGAAPGAIAAGGTGPMSTARFLGTAGAQGAAAGSGYDTENRGRGALVGGAAGVATAGALKGAATGLDKTAKNAIDKSNELIVQTFMTPAQRAAYQRAHGLDSMRQLGSDARDAGLFKTAILPPRAATVAKNASKVMDETGNKIGNFEDDLLKQGVDPDVSVKPIADELRGVADETGHLPALGADEAAGTLTKQADLLEAQQPQQPYTPVRQALPFSEASKLKRLLGKQINWDKNPRAQQVAQGTEEARKLTWKGVTQQIDKALGADPRIDPAKLANYGTAKKDFSVSATAFDPAVSMMEREGETGLGARDLMAATAFGGGNPLVGGLASMANKNMAGMVPAIASNKLRQYAGTISGPAALSPTNRPISTARKVFNKTPGLAPLMRGMSRVAPVGSADNVNEMVKRLGPDKANEETKKQLNELLPGGPK